MQWLINLVAALSKIYTDQQITIAKDYTDSQIALQTHVPVGAIMPWYGNVASIPEGWLRCNGSFGTPDMRSVVVIGAGPTYGWGTHGGSVTHTHDDGFGIAEGGQIDPEANNLPPYIALWWIIKT